MQVTTVTAFTKSKWRGRLFHLIKWLGFLLVICLLCRYIYIQDDFLDSLIAALYTAQWQWIIFVIFLLPVNWFMEAWKWKILAKPVEQISIWAAFRGVFTGLALTAITPANLGDYGGRILQLNSDVRKKATGGLLIGNAFQLLSTLIFGMIGIERVFFYNFQWHSWLCFVVMEVLIMLLCLLIITRKSRTRCVGFLDKFLPLKTRDFYWLIRSYSTVTISNVFFLSLFRYLVFSIQFLILLKFVFGIPLSAMSLFQGISWVLVSKALLPTLNFVSDLGVRELFSVYYFNHLDVEISSVLLASFTLWVINILTPSLLGAFFILKLKWIDTK